MCSRRASFDECRPSTPIRVAVVVTVVALLLCGRSARAQEPVDFYHNFRKSALPPGWEQIPQRPEDAEQFHFEPEGLRITFPADRVQPETGVRGHPPLAGDFEVTATVEVLRLEPPTSGYGAGVGIAVETATQLAYLKRQITPKGKHIVLWGRRRRDAETKKDLWFQNGPPCSETLLRLRLKRAGDTLSYWWAPGADGDDFQEVLWSRGKIPFGSEPVQNVRVTAGNGRLAALMEVRLLDLRIRSGTTLSEAPRTEPAPRGGRRWLILAGVVIIGIGMAAGIVVALRRRRAAAPVAEPAEVTALTLLLSCPDCGKELRAPAELAGKRVRCVHCGHAVPVPDAPPRHSAAD
jgi:DNA-directed RNA polymerase subunit RPC12/RpoP